jgi:hypothetical protein
MVMCLTIGQPLRVRPVQLGRTVGEIPESSVLSVPYVSNLERGCGYPTLEAPGSRAGQSFGPFDGQHGWR